MPDMKDHPMESNNQEQLIFKHAISTVVVSRTAHASPAPHAQGGGQAVAHGAHGAPHGEPAS
jgi:hypothetical protein